MSQLSVKIWSKNFGRDHLNQRGIKNYVKIMGDLFWQEGFLPGHSSLRNFFSSSDPWNGSPRSERKKSEILLLFVLFFTFVSLVFCPILFVFCCLSNHPSLTRVWPQLNSRKLNHVLIRNLGSAIELSSKSFFFKFNSFFFFLMPFPAL